MPVAVHSAVGEVLTHRYDNARTGSFAGETLLNQKSVKQLRLSRKLPVDGELYAQPLVVQSAARTLVIVATMQNSVFAFDPANGETVWRLGADRELGIPAFSKRNIGGAHGILSTPAIDATTRRLYVVSRDCDPAFPPEAPSCVFQLTAVDVDTGLVHKQVTIQGAVDSPSAGPSVAFDPNLHWNRPALLLSQGRLFVAFGSGPNGDLHEEDFVYHGWVFRFDATDVDRAPDVFCTTPAGRGGAVWQGGSGPAADEGAIYLVGANGILSNTTHPPGDFPAAPTGQEDSVFKLPISGPWPQPGEPVTQYADTRPYLADGNVFQYMESGDVGFGSSGPMLIPGTDRLLVGSKPALVYLLETGALSTVQTPLSPFSQLPLKPQHDFYLHGWWDIPPIYGAFVFHRPRDSAGDPAPHGFAFAWPSKDKLKSFRYDFVSGKLAVDRVAEAEALEGGGNLVLSSDAGHPDSAVLWALSRAPGKPQPAGKLWAFDPVTLELLTSADVPAWSKFTPPTVVGGRVYVPSTSNQPGTTQQLLVFGLEK